MWMYALKRLLLIFPTLIGIITINFLIVQGAPGGPIERMLAKLEHGSNGQIEGLGDKTNPDMAAGGAEFSTNLQYTGSAGVDPTFIKQLEKQYGFDKPAIERYWIMLKDYAKFDFGESFATKRPVIDMLFERLPVSISLGLWTLLIVYCISIPLGIRKAVRDGSRFDAWTSILVVVGYAVPSFLVAVILIICFSGGSFLDWFPLSGLISDGLQDYPWYSPTVIIDYFWHMALPVLSMVITGFASLTLLTKDAFLEEINKQYVTTARAKGLSERRILYKHIFRNAMLIVIAGFPAAFVNILFTSSLLIEVIFSLEGIGLLGFEAIIRRDYPIMFGTLFIFSLVGLLLHLLGDLTYMLVDRRITFDKKEG